LGLQPLVLEEALLDGHEERRLAGEADVADLDLREAVRPHGSGLGLLAATGQRQGGSCEQRERMDLHASDAPFRSSRRRTAEHEARREIADARGFYSTTRQRPTPRLRGPARDG